MSGSARSTSASALGLIETRGLIGVLEAADTAAKAADVQLMGIERIGGGFVSLRLCGDVAAVQAAVQAGSAAARGISTLVSAHVIPAPQVGMDVITSTAAVAGTTGRSPGTDPPADPPAVPAATLSGAAGLNDDGFSPEELTSMPVARLRQLARRIPGVALKGREVSRANKQQLLAELRRALGREGG